MFAAICFCSFPAFGSFDNTANYARSPNSNSNNNNIRQAALDLHFDFGKKLILLLSVQCINS